MLTQLTVFFLFFIISNISSLTRYQLKEGDDCELKNGIQGICIKSSGCIRVNPKTFGRRFPWKRCGFQGEKSLYCCFGSMKKAKDACQIYQQKVTPKSQNQISGGTLARINELPHMAALWYENPTGDDSESTNWKCGGTLISPNFVLTAAHCVDKEKPLKIRVGDTDLKARADDRTAKEYDISETFVHPSYNRRRSSYNDIALIKTKQNVNFNPYVYPACIQTEGRIKAYEFGISGWGQTDFNQGGVNETNQPLRKATIRGIRREDCDNSYLKLSAANYEVTIPKGIAKSQICAKTRRRMGSNTCMGDSGGPLHYQTGEIFYIVGITSIGATCGGEMPGIYTRVSYFAPWITNLVWKT